jgi:hypothetical protein
MDSNPKKLEQTYRSISGGPELLDYFSSVPSFHDAEIIGLELNRTSASYLKIHGWVLDRKNDLQNKTLKHATVTFILGGITDLQLDGFSKQNVIGSLTIARTESDPDRKAYYSIEAFHENDFELTLEPCYGLDGRIRCKKIAIMFTPDIPTDTIHGWRSNET